MQILAKFSETSFQILRLLSEASFSRRAVLNLLDIKNLHDITYEILHAMFEVIVALNPQTDSPILSEVNR